MTKNTQKIKKIGLKSQKDKEDSLVKKKLFWVEISARSYASFKLWLIQKKAPKNWGSVNIAQNT